MRDYLDIITAAAHTPLRALVAVVLQTIPVLNIFFIGYLMRIARHAEEPVSFAGWERPGTLFVDGLRFIGVCLLFMLPFLLISFILWAVIGGGETFLWWIFPSLYLFVFFYLMPSILVHESRGPLQSFSLGMIRDSLHVHYLLHWFIIMAAGFIFNIIISVLSQLAGILVILGFVVSTYLLLCTASVFSHLIPGSQTK